MNIKSVSKQLISFILPVTTLIIVPLLIERKFSIESIPVSIIGLLFVCAGLAVLIITISTLIILGRGTLAPWNPTSKLVTEGIYGHVRHPMIMGVLTILLGESILFGSVNIFIWFIIFFIANNIYFVLYEGPDLEKKFGDEYKSYKSNVKRWIPRIKAYSPEKENNYI